MAKILEFKSKDKAGKEKTVGKMEIRNQSNAAAELYFYGDIVGSTWDVWQQEDKCPQDVQDFLNDLDGVKDISIFINSGGGAVFGGLAIYNILKRHPANKTVRVDGLAASIASVIALAGDIVIIPKTAQFMIHKAWIGLWGAFTADEFRQLAKELDVCNQSILNVYAENLKDGVSIDTISQMMDNETWMTGDEAAKYFNVQVEEIPAAAACADSMFFAKYKHVPQNLINRPKPDLLQPGNKVLHYQAKDGVIPDNVSSETAPEDTPWAAPILSDFTDKTWDELTDTEKNNIAGHYAWTQGLPPDIFGDLKLPHHRASDGKVVWDGVENAAARLDTTDIPEEDKKGVRQHLGSHYHQFGKTPPWEQDSSDNKTSGQEPKNDLEIAVLKAKLALEREL